MPASTTGLMPFCLLSTVFHCGSDRRKSISSPFAVPRDISLSVAALREDVSWRTLQTPSSGPPSQSSAQDRVPIYSDVLAVVTQKPTAPLGQSGRRLQYLQAILGFLSLWLDIAWSCSRSHGGIACLAGWAGLGMQPAATLHQGRHAKGCFPERRHSFRPPSQHP